MKLAYIILSIAVSLPESFLVCDAVKPPLSTLFRSSALVVPRGGAGPLDPTMVAKTAATANLVLNGISALGPEKALQTYGIESPTPLHIFVGQREWTIFSAACLTAYLWIVHDKSINTAVGYGTFPIILDVVRSILNDDEKKLGIPNIGQVVVALLPLVVNAYTCLTDMESANTVTMICGAFNMVNGLWYFLDSENPGKAWRVKEVVDPILLGSVKWMGVSLVVYGIVLVGMSMGVDAFKLMGYVMIPVVLNMVYETFVNKKVDMHGLNKSLYYVWIVYGLVVIGTLAID